MTERARLPSIRAYEIIVGVDYSRVSERALNAALDLARKRTGSRVHVLAVAPGEGPQLPEELTEDSKQEFLKQAHATLDAYVEDQLGKRDGPVNRKSIRTSVDFGNPAERILALAEMVSANLIVLGTHSKNVIERAVVGSVTQEILRQSPCSVLVVRADEEH